MPVSSKFDPSLLHVVCCISNPVRYNSRYQLYKRFNAEMQAAGANLITVEGAFGNRAHEITPPVYGKHLQVRTSSEIWHKENLLNLGIAALPSDWKYVAWVDADISFINPNWITETIETLQHHPFCQLFESVIDEGPTGSIIATYSSFGSQFLKGIPPSILAQTNEQTGQFGHPGFSWGATREAIESVGGLIDQAILGASDHHMALALINQAEFSMPGDISQGYKDMVLGWQEQAKADRLINNIGAVSGTISHHWHGSKTKRNYIGRWEILTKHKYDPKFDIKRNAQGVYELTAKGERMRNDLRNYFRARNEDGLDE